MALELVTGPVREPVTLDEAKAHLRLEIPDDDGLLAGYLIAAREYIEGQTKRDLVTKTWDYTIDYGWPVRGSEIGWRQFIRLPINPIQSVTSVAYVDEAGVTQTLDPSKYIVASRTSYSFITPAYDTTWNTTRRVPDAVTVRFVSGYTECPQDLKAALMLLAGHFYENRESVSGKAMHEVPLSVEAMIAPYTDRSL
jgi:uncharacterized phiE125 gp8 family phage protein